MKHVKQTSKRSNRNSVMKNKVTAILDTVDRCQPRLEIAKERNKKMDNKSVRTVQITV